MIWTPPNVRLARGSDLWPPADLIELPGRGYLRHRGGWMSLGYQPDGAPNLAKVFDGPKQLKMLVSLDVREGWGPLLHLSMSLPVGYPDWDLIYAVTRAVFGTEVDAMLPIPREEAYIHGMTADQRAGVARQVFHVVEMPQVWPREGS